MIVAIDSGNTSTKIGLFQKGKLVKISEKQAYTDLINEVRSLKPRQVIISSVNFPPDTIKKDLFPFSSFLITHETPLPFTLAYKTPRTLGIDRIALTAGARKLNPGHNSLVIDAGTCITYDFIDASGIYHGGGISPGIDMRFKALHQFTAHLPRVEFDGHPELTGSTTEDSIKSGVINGTIEEISGIINRYSLVNKNLRVILSGGTAKFFESKIKDSIFAVPNLVLLGVYYIYVFNKKQN